MSERPEPGGPGTEPPKQVGVPGPEPEATGSELSGEPEGPPPDETSGADSTGAAGAESPSEGESPEAGSLPEVDSTEVSGAGTSSEAAQTEASGAEPSEAAPSDDGGQAGGPSRGSGAVAAAVGWVRARLEAMVVPALALVTALVVGGLVIVFSNPDTLHSWTGFFRHPGGTLSESWHLVADSYRALYDSSLGSWDAFSRTLFEAAPLAFAGLSVALAFRAGLFNIGGAGQLIVGAMCAGWVGFTWDLPRWLHLPLAVVVGFAAGAAWGAIAGLLKAQTGAHEVITTIMLNVVALRLLDYALRQTAFQRPGRADPISEPVAESARLPVFDMGDLALHGGLILVIAAAWLVWWVLNRSTLGFTMRAVGANPFASRCAGMRVGRTYVVAMLLAGGLAGLAGTTNILGRPSYSLHPAYFRDLGFEGIAVALLGRANPVGVVLSALLFGILRQGSSGMQATTSTPVDIIGVIQALIIVFVAAPALIRALYRVRAGREVEPAFTTGWGA